ncbi:MAG: GvpL/GvpF family gas vesicle protein [Ignavibacteriaceae bacterium]
MNNELIYVYCLSNSSPELSLYAEFNGLKCIEFGGFFVTYKKVSEDEFSEENLKRNITNIAWMEINAREHINVINKIMKNNTVIPFKFGTIYKSEEGLEKFIEDYTLSLNKNMIIINGKEEWTVKIYCNRDELKNQIEELSKDVSDLEIQIRNSSPGRAYLLERKKSDLMEMEIDKLSKNYGASYYELFLKLSESTRINNLLPKNLTGRNDDMILNAAFLVSKDKVGEFVNTSNIL